MKKRRKIKHKPKHKPKPKPKPKPVPPKREPRTYADWYAENKETLSKRRKDRYRTDPEYQAKAKAQARAYYLKKKRLQRGESNEEY